MNTIEEYHENLKSNDVEISFKRVDGSIRNAIHSADEYNENAIVQNEYTFNKSGQVIFYEKGVGIRSFDKNRQITFKNI